MFLQDLAWPFDDGSAATIVGGRRRLSQEFTKFKPEMKGASSPQQLREHTKTLQALAISTPQTDSLTSYMYRGNVRTLGTRVRTRGLAPRTGVMVFVHSSFGVGLNTQG